ncbi:MAG: decarboxylating 6-phosphogluconate dehydrogenase [Thermodesulfovibrionales bacterium]|nr:decarboxylating 6-phosphogluconate dehydrogenase [Thermodesulfovibrionales bacterium]
MRIGIVGLGKMGLNMTRRLLKGRHKVVAFNRSKPAVREAVRAGAIGASSLSVLVSKLPTPRVLWLMLPAGLPTEDTIDELKSLLSKGDTIVDGANSNYKDSVRRELELKPYGIRFMDAGVSGGIWGLKIGYCLMVGGAAGTYRKVLPALKTLAPKNGYLHCGPVGSGHFVKMVHNGIEYGMMSAYGEGFAILRASEEFGDQFDFHKISRLWNQGSVIRSWLLELAESAFNKDPGLETLEPYVPDSGEGRWTVDAAVESGVPAPVITAALFQRFSSRGNGDFSDMLLSALRNEFGGHAVKKKVKKKVMKKKGAKK